ncbi:MAG: hypothetical protein HZC24_02700 [Rhodocyclales bacterium]|nr:hypothetical protein [Rhodocyclales bacterium]
MFATRILAAAVVVTLAACANPQGKTQTAATSAQQAGIEKGMDLLAAGQANAANGEFNRALARTPSNANLHFLNGLAYRRLAQESGQTVLPLAESGYRLALEFNPGHWLAAWHLGLLQLEQGQYAEARKSFARAARLRPRNADIQLALAGSAYLASDVPVALWAAEKTLTLRPGDPEALRIAALSSAALGMESGARAFSDSLRAVRSAVEVEDLDDRLNDWKRVLAQAPDSLLAPAAAPALAPGAAQPVANPVGEQGPLAVGWSDCNASAASSGNSWSSGSSSSSWGGSGSGSADTTERLQPLPSPCKGVPLPRMAVIDVTIIRTQEVTQYSQGVNLLDGLKVILGGKWEQTRSSSTADGPTFSKSITRSLSLPAAGIEYSLNIFNAADATADVIARPSLLALDRTPATFFSGATVSVALSGQYGGSLSDKNIGVSLSVTPTFIDDERLLLAVKGARSFIEPTELQGLKANALSTSNNIVSTNVIMRFGETLILSGLREREHTKDKAGVPLLRDVPILQYLFSTHVDFDYAHHVLILLTPRKPSTLAETERTVQAYARSPEFQVERDDAGDEAMNALRQRRPNLEAILAKIQLSQYRHEFHSGDLSSRRFAPSPSIERVLDDIKQMLYF